jgi:hypothetical protein
MMLGRARLPEKWTAPINDTLETGVHGYYRTKIADLAAQTVQIARRLRK